MKYTTTLMGAALTMSMPLHAALLLHSTMDNVDVGAGAGTDDTNTATFNVGNSAGSDGTAGASAHTVPALTTIIPLTSGGTGQFGQALSFQALENAGVRYDGITAPGTGSYTASLWFNFNGTGSNGALIGQGLNNSSGGEGWVIFWENNDLVFRIGQSGFGADQRASMRQEDTTGLTNGWHMATMVIDSVAGELRGYVDGTIVDTQGGGGPSDNTFVTEGDGIASTDPILLGLRGFGGFAPIVDLDDVGIWNTALTTAEIGDIYASGIAVPEPSSTALLGLGGLALILRRKK